MYETYATARYDAQIRFLSILKSPTYSRLVDVYGEKWWVVIKGELPFPYRFGKYNNDADRMGALDLPCYVSIFQSHRDLFKGQKTPAGVVIDDRFFAIMSSLKEVRNKISHYGTAEVSKEEYESDVSVMVEIGSYFNENAYEIIHGIDDSAAMPTRDVRAPKNQDCKRIAVSQHVALPENPQLVQPELDNTVRNEQTPVVPTAEIPVSADLSDSSSTSPKTEEPNDSFQPAEPVETQTMHHNVEQGEYTWSKYIENGREQYGCLMNGEVVSRSAYMDGDAIRPLYDSDYTGFALIAYGGGDYYAGYVVNGQRQGFGKMVPRTGAEFDVGFYSRNVFLGELSNDVDPSALSSSEVSNVTINLKRKPATKETVSLECQVRNGALNGNGTLEFNDGREQPHCKTAVFCNNRLLGEYVSIIGNKTHPLSDLSNYVGQILIKEKNSTYSGCWDRGCRSGKGKLEVCGDYTYDGDWVDDSPQGAGRYTYANGDEYEGTVYKGLYNGSGRYTYSDSSYYEGGFQFDLRHGRGCYVRMNEYKITGTWDYDLLSGEASVTSPSGERVFTGVFENGQCVKTTHITDEFYRLPLCEEFGIERPTKSKTEPKKDHHEYYSHSDHPHESPASAPMRHYYDSYNDSSRDNNYGYPKNMYEYWKDILS